MNYHARRQSIQAFIVSSQVDALLITDFYNILYLTGFKTLSPHEKEATLIVTPKGCYIITDTRYETEVYSHFKDVDDVYVMIQRFNSSFIQIVSSILTDHSIQRLGFEKHDVSYAWFEHLQKEMPIITLKPISNEMLKLRTIKDVRELGFMRKAAELTDKCLSAIVPHLRAGIHERQIIHLMESWIRNHNVEFSFNPIVAFDEHSALPHYNNKQSDGVLSDNSIVLIDMGITYNDYCSDITRIFFCCAPTLEQKNTYEDLLSIQNKTIETLQPRRKMEDIDSVAREGLIKKGYPAIPHSTGHGIGLEVHEGLRFASTITDKLPDNTVFTIEPGIYYEGKWGIRIEDTIAVIDGKVESLTKFPKDLTVL